MATYHVSVSTNSEHDPAGTLSRVQMRIMGEGGEKTDWLILNSFLPDIIGTGESRTYKLDTPDVGKPILVEMKLVGAKDDPWFCNEITVKHRRKNYEFPFYDWLEETEVAVGRGKGCLPQKETNSYVLEKRKLEVEQTRTKFAWMPNPDPSSLSYGFPRHLPAATKDDLPIFFRWAEVRNDSFEESVAVGRQLAARNLSSKITLDSLDSFKQIAEGLTESLPPFIDSWDTDEEMGRQMLNGIIPQIVARCDALPSYCNITNAHCALPEKLSLEEEMKEGRIFITDFKTLTEGTPFNPNPTTKQPLFAPEAIGLFHATRHGSFLPIAIQLTPNDPESIFSPKDSTDDWLLAKMYFQSAKAAVHEWAYHYVLTHAVSETIAISTFRNFARSHPMYKLLRPHVRTCVRINTFARVVLLPPLTPANLSVARAAAGVGRKAFNEFNFSMMDIPKHFQDNGTDDEDKLQNFHYRDDALDIWDVIEDYVKDVIEEFYECDEDVANDFELQAWTDDIGKEGFGWQDGNRRGMPESIKTVDELVRICTMIIFNTTALHAAINFGQFEIYQFSPNNPPSMQLPVHKKGEANLERILASLPDVQISSLFVATTYSLSQFTENEVWIGQVKHALFTSRGVKQHQRRFARKLKRLSRKMGRRNRKLKIPYIYLLPERIPNSVAN